MMIFKILGAMVGFYTCYAAVKGEVYAKSGILGRTVSRAASPTYFWTVIVIYAGLSVALIIIF